MTIVAMMMAGDHGHGAASCKNADHFMKQLTHQSCGTAVTPTSNSNEQEYW